MIPDSSTTNYTFQNGDVITSALAEAVTGVVTAPPRGIGIGTLVQDYVGYGTTGLVKGVLLNLSITAGGSGYSNPGIYTGITLTTVTGIGSSAYGTVTIGAGNSATTISAFAGGKGYVVGDVLTAADGLVGGRSGGAQFQATVTSVETRLYLKLTANQKFAGSITLPDHIADGNAGSLTTSLLTSYSVDHTPTSTDVGGSIDFTNDRIVVGVGHQYGNGDPVIYDAKGGTMPTASGNGILDQTTYYTKVVGVSSVELYYDYSLVNKLNFTGSGIGTHRLLRNVTNTAAEKLVIVGHGYSTGTPFRIFGAAPTGITTHEFYYIGAVTTNAFSLHETQADALLSVNGVTFSPVAFAATGPGGITTFIHQNIRYRKHVNTSSSNLNNFALLARDSIDASNIVSGIVATTRLGSGTANDQTVLAGNSEFKKAIFSVGIGTTSVLGISSYSSATLAPSGIGINTYFGNVVLNVSDAKAAPADVFSTKGVARFKTSTFAIGDDGQVTIKPGTQGDIDASSLQGQGPAYYLNSANHTGSVPITRGGTGLTGVPALGAILIGNASAYNLTTSPAFTGNVTLPRMFVDRSGNVASGINWYSSGYTTWATYMSPAGQAGSGPTGNITPPSGTLVTSWALRNFIENYAGYGWTWESSGSAGGQPTVVAEIRASDGSFRTGGNITAVGNITASGNITVGGSLVFGSTTFPVPTSSNIGATLRYDDRGIYWDNEQGDVYTGGYVVRGYTMGGYKDGVAWTNVNRTDHASQTTYNLGDQVTTIDAYTGASSNGTFAYMFNPGGAWTAQGNQINRFNMLTDSNSDIATTMLTTKDRNSVMRYKFIYAYIFGDSRPEKFIHATETPVLFLGVNDSNGSHAGNPSCGQGELRGWHNVSGTRANYLEFATESWNAWGSVPSVDGTNKTISSYTGYMYWNTGGGYQTNNAMSKRDDYTGSQILTIAKPGVTGEESFHTGELAGYMVGMYNGAQNNQGGLMNYTNNTFTFVSGLNSQGTAGRASAAGIEYGRGV